MDPEANTLQSKPVEQTQNEARPLVSFILLAYNQERYIREAVEGAFSQTYSPLEIILSDDCSTDRTFEIMQEMVINYNGNHKIILNRNKNNLGILGNVNKCIELAHGNVIITSGGDDISLKNRVEFMMNTKFFLESNVYAAFSDAEIIDDQNNILSPFYFDRTNINIYQSNYHLTRWDKKVNWIFSQHPFFKPMKQDYISGIIGATAAYKRDIFDLFGHFEGHSGAEDEILWFRSQLIGGIYFVPYVLVKYRHHDDSCVPDSLYLKNKNAYEERILEYCIIRDKNKMKDLNTAYNKNIIDDKKYKKLIMQTRINFKKNQFLYAIKKKNMLIGILTLMSLIITGNVKETIGWAIFHCMPKVYNLLKR